MFGWTLYIVSCTLIFVSTCMVNDTITLQVTVKGAASVVKAQVSEKQLVYMYNYSSYSCTIMYCDYVAHTLWFIRFQYYNVECYVTRK